MLLAFSTDTLRTLALQREARWEHRETRRLAGSRLVVVGPGSDRARGGAHAPARSGMEVAAVGRTARRRRRSRVRSRRSSSLHEALATADHVVNALPLTPATAGLFDAAAFAAMPATATFVNVGRGGTVDEPALIDALRTGGIAGAALDVFARGAAARPEPAVVDARTSSSRRTCAGTFAGWEREAVGGLRGQRRPVGARASRCATSWTRGWGSASAERPPVGSVRLPFVRTRT